jgi:hypothetical protein
MRSRSPLFSSIAALCLGLVVSSYALAAPRPPPPDAAPAPLPPGTGKPDPQEVAGAETAPPADTPPPAPISQPQMPTPKPPPQMDGEPRPPPPEDFAEGDHFEFSMGFLAGQRSYKDTSFQFEDGAAEGIGGGGLVEPFVKPPFDKVTVLGLRYDLRLVMSYIRMTVGFDLPFPTYKASDSTGMYDVAGVQRKVTVQSLSAKELRFGIGGEFPYKRIAVYADLLGGVHWVDTELAIDGYTAEYGALSFAFSGRAGVRAHVREWFFATASGEVGFVGDIRWNAEVAVGFSVK